MSHLGPSPAGFLREHKGTRRANVDSAHTPSIEYSEEYLLRETYKQFPVLWDPIHGEYYKKPRKQDAWREIAATIEVTHEECKNKMSSLLSSLRREKSREKKHKGKQNRKEPAVVNEGGPEIVTAIGAETSGGEFVSPRQPKRARGHEGEDRAVLVDAIGILGQLPSRRSEHNS
ncbi:hypothetical protein PR048_032945 [Dryococelus australis]|uniref:MADF domain-containing protein n=1 Tax=Dryococelus australis TaxID=614101 RepID=A0ABQ9G3N8_9NEOP|nr:hypothetical protein PR048_032945 [Dryococelus australis]